MTSYNKEKQRQYMKKYRIKNKAKLNKKSRKYYHKNKEKDLDRRKQYYIDNKETILKKRMLKEYGITFEEYSIILKKQEGKCAICGQYEKSKTVSGELKPLAVDHNHTTNKIRGLLCTNCNVGLGYFNENILILIKAINYLKKYKD